MKNTFKFTSKAGTLTAIRHLVRHSTVLPLFSFTAARWRADSHEIIDRIQSRFPAARLIVRSSSADEDRSCSSNAGAFESVLNVSSRSRTQIARAVRRVIQSYGGPRSAEGRHHVLIQPMQTDVKISGVILTYDRELNGPYYVINYDDASSRTDRVTAGHAGRTLRVFRQAADSIQQPEFRRLIAAVREIERITRRRHLDIEFAIDRSGRVILFQVRPLVMNGVVPTSASGEAAVRSKLRALKNRFRRLSAPSERVAGRTSCFSDMADWNPAEIIGSQPNPLSYSLYRELIMDRAWAEAREALGYQPVRDTRLMVAFAGKPYVDVRASFASLLPAGMPRRDRERVVESCLATFRAKPYLQDKVEFKIIPSCLDFNFEERARALRGAGMSPRDIRGFRRRLAELTNRLVIDGDSIIRGEMENIRRLRRRPGMSDAGLGDAAAFKRELNRMLSETLKHGTRPFAALARLAFVGNAILCSMIDRRMIHRSDYNRFFRSVYTVVGRFCEDMHCYAKGIISIDTILERYGHLRPGTYDITTPRYDEAAERYFPRHSVAPPAAPRRALIRLGDRHARAFRRAGFRFTPARLCDFARNAIQAREESKFHFTRHVSEVLKLITAFGGRMGFKPAELAYLSIPFIRRSISRSRSRSELAGLWRGEIRRKKEAFERNRSIYLPPVILTEGDIEAPAGFDERPNFVTQHKVSGALCWIKDVRETPGIEDKILLMERADPGFDWIFGFRIKGLITCYGGVASHMAIRCGEFGLPAAIGCGQKTFLALCKAHLVELDCATRRVHIIR